MVSMMKKHSITNDPAVMGQATRQYQSVVEIDVALARPIDSPECSFWTSAHHLIFP